MFFFEYNIVYRFIKSAVQIRRDVRLTLRISQSMIGVVSSSNLYSIRNIDSKPMYEWYTSESCASITCFTATARWKRIGSTHEEVPSPTQNRFLIRFDRRVYRKPIPFYRYDETVSFWSPLWYCRRAPNDRFGAIIIEHDPPRYGTTGPPVRRTTEQRFRPNSQLVSPRSRLRSSIVLGSARVRNSFSDYRLSSSSSLSSLLNPLKDHETRTRGFCATVEARSVCTWREYESVLKLTVYVYGIETLTSPERLLVACLIVTTTRLLE